MKPKRDFGILFWVHLLLIIFAYASPFLVPWQWILLGVVLSIAQEMIFRGCVLTKAQFGRDPDMTFYYRYLTLLGIRVNKKKLKFFMAWIMPCLVLMFALCWQILLHNLPYFFNSNITT